MQVYIDIKETTLKSNRLKIRPFKKDDLEDFYEFAKVDGVGQLAGWKPHGSIEESIEILNIFIEGKKEFAIELEGKVIGSIGIKNYNEKLFPNLEEKRVCELGFVLSKDYWGKGLMPEAVKEVMTWLFKVQNIDAIICGYFSRNNRSRRVQEKLGFKYIADYKYKTRIGNIEDTKMMIIYKEEFTKIRHT